MKTINLQLNPSLLFTSNGEEIPEPPDWLPDRFEFIYGIVGDHYNTADGLKKLRSLGRSDTKKDSEPVKLFGGSKGDTRQVLEYLSTCDRRVSSLAIAQATGLTDERVRAILKKATHKGYTQCIRIPGGFRYKLICLTKERARKYG